MVWFSGTSSICIVNLKEFSYVEIKDFLPQLNDKIFGVACRAVSNQDCSKVLVSFVIESQFSLAFQLKGREPDKHILEDILPKCKKILLTLDGNLYDMEVSLNESIVFVCGATQKLNGAPSNAVVTAMQFDKTLSIVDEVVLSEQKVQAAICMKRLPQDDHLLVGCFKNLVVLNFVGNSFQFIRMIPNLHMSKVFAY